MSRDLVEAFHRMAQTAAALAVARALYEIAKRANDRFVKVEDLLDVANRLLAESQGHEADEVSP